MALSELVAPSGTVSRRQMNVIFGTVLLGMLLSALDQTVVSTALPTIVGDLGGAEHISWVVSSYLLADTIATVLAGKFGDLFGRKLVFQVSIAVFILASAACGLAGDLTWLIGWRAVQGARCRWPRGDSDCIDCRRHPASRAWQVPGRPRCGLLA